MEHFLFFFTKLFVEFHFRSGHFFKSKRKYELAAICVLFIESQITTQYLSKSSTYFITKTVATRVDMGVYLRILLNRHFKQIFSFLTLYTDSLICYTKLHADIFKGVKSHEPLRFHSYVVPL